MLSTLTTRSRHGSITALSEMASGWAGLRRRPGFTGPWGVTVTSHSLSVLGCTAPIIQTPASQEYYRNDSVNVWEQTLLFKVYVLKNVQFLKPFCLGKLLIHARNGQAGSQKMSEEEVFPISHLERLWTTSRHVTGPWAPQPPLCSWAPRSCTYDKLLLLTTSPRGLEPNMPHKEDWFQSHVPDEAPYQWEPTNHLWRLRASSTGVRRAASLSCFLPRMSCFLRLPLYLWLHWLMTRFRKHTPNVPRFLHAWSEYGLINI